MIIGKENVPNGFVQRAVSVFFVFFVFMTFPIFFPAFSFFPFVSLWKLYDIVQLSALRTTQLKKTKLFWGSENLSVQEL